MIQAVTPGYFFMDKTMDDLRSAAVLDFIQYGPNLREPMIDYIRALEARVLQLEHDQRVEGAQVMMSVENLRIAPKPEGSRER